MVDESKVKSLIRDDLAWEKLDKDVKGEVLAHFIFNGEDFYGEILSSEGAFNKEVSLSLMDKVLNKVDGKVDISIGGEEMKAEYAPDGPGSLKMVSVKSDNFSGLILDLMRMLCKEGVLKF